jgi:methionyl-tRNA formyltransferase
MSSSVRILFIGSGEIAVPSFQRLIADGYKPVALVTQPDRPAGRNRVLTPTPIKVAAVEAGIPVLQPEVIREPEALEEIRAYEPDLIVVMAYGQILPKALIQMPRIACINLHGSLLPRHRGASCVQSAIEAGDPETGITVMHVAPRLDSGDIIHKKSTPILAHDTGGAVHDRLAEVAAEALLEALPALIAGTAARIVQDETLSTYAPKLERDAGKLDFTQDILTLERRIRAYDPWPGTWCWAEDGSGKKRLKIFPGTWISGRSGELGRISISPEGALVIHTADGSYLPAEVQLDGSRRMPARDWVRGLRQPDQWLLS